MIEEQLVSQSEEMEFEEFQKIVLADYKLAIESREASILGRKEALVGKAKFGIFGGGKEIPQIALAKTFKKGDFRAGYYRDQTLMMALNLITLEQFFAQLYANPDLAFDPHSGGRQMNSHFATTSVDENGEWLNLREQYNTSADCSPTAAQMARAVGLAFASKIYRASNDLDGNIFSDNGNEICFATIGDASTSEGLFWEAINAAGVLKIPLAVSVWDDGYGISVPKEYQTTKGSISEVLAGFKTNEKGEGIDIYTAKGWDYTGLCEMYEEGIAKMRETHRPAIFHIEEVTQPQGHSTSGSHGRYKSAERLQWEKDFDGIAKMREWILETEYETETGAIVSLVEDASVLDEIEKEAKENVKQASKQSWQNYMAPIKTQIEETKRLLVDLAEYSENGKKILAIKAELELKKDALRKDVVSSVKQGLYCTAGEDVETRGALVAYKELLEQENREKFNSHLYSQSPKSALDVKVVPVEYDDDSPMINGYEILNKAFDNILENDPRVFAFGEDVGNIGDVNQGFAGLQKKYSELRVFDVGIREATIVGQAIGMAMRGLRPIAEIQYLDYLIYGLQPLTDDVASLHYRTKGRQVVPLIIRTRGHRLEGVWHTGSPMGMVINALRGMYVLTPRNMVQAVGFYNTLLKSDDPALMIECLNGYRLKEKLPSNIEEFTVPLGVPEVLKEGNDVTIVTYGSCVRIAQQAIEKLEELNVSVELIDVQTLLPFDIHNSIVESLIKTNRVVFLDEDVPGGASAYMMQKVLDVQNGYLYLDASPRCVSSHSHRSAYGTDGDYFSKPNVEDVFEAVYMLMHEFDPITYPALF